MSMETAAQWHCVFDPEIRRLFGVCVVYTIVCLPGSAMDVPSLVAISGQSLFVSFVSIGLKAGQSLMGFRKCQIR